MLTGAHLYYVVRQC